MTSLAITDKGLRSIGLTRIEFLARLWEASLVSANTRVAYRGDLDDFVAFCHQHQVQPLLATRPVLDAYARNLEAYGKSAATVARRLAALSSFYAYIVEGGVMATSPVERVRRPRVSSDSPMLGLDGDDARALLGAAEAASPRDHALVCLLLFNGLRVSEAINLMVADLDHERGHRIVRIGGKGGRRRTAPLAPRAVAAIDSAVGNRDQGPVLLANDGGPMNRHQAARAIGRLCRAAGITKRITPHSLRHTMVTLSLEAGVPIHLVQDAAGHASPETTRRYDRARHALDGHATYALAQHLGST